MGINESVIELRLKERLEDYGFAVIKLVTPGTAGVMDRMILWPKYCPGQPMFVEVKKPRQKLRKLQEARAMDWKARGVAVLKPCTTLDEVEQLCTELIEYVITKMP